MIMQKINKFVLGLGALFVLLSTSALPTATVAAAPIDVFKSCKSAGASGDAVCKDQSNQKLFGTGGIWNRILNVMIFIVGTVAVLMIIIGGLRYVLSGGDSNAINGAKNTILYSVVGIVIAVMSYAIVNFVITRI